MSKLQSFFKEIKKASLGHKISSVGIEFGSSSIKVVNFVENRGIVSLQNYGEIDLGPFVGKAHGSVANLEADKLKEVTSILLQNVPVEEPEAVTVAIPLSATLVIPLEVEVNDASDMDKLVESELESKVPVPLTSVHIGWQLVSEEPIEPGQTDKSSNTEKNEAPIVGSNVAPTKKVSLLCYVINKDIMESYQSVVEHLGFQIENFELEVYSVLRSAVGKDVANATIVDIGARYTKIYVAQNGKIVQAIKKLQGGVDFTNIISSILNVDFAKAENLKRNIHLQKMQDGKVSAALRGQITEIVESIRTVRQEFKSEQVPLYLCGGGSLLFGLPEQIAAELKAKVIICQPFINANAPQYLDKLLVETGPEYAVAAGLALKYIRNI